MLIITNHNDWSNIWAKSYEGDALYDRGKLESVHNGSRTAQFL